MKEFSFGELLLAFEIFRFIFAFEDDLMKRFGTDKVKTMVQALGMPEGQAIQNKMLSKLKNIF